MYVLGIIPARSGSKGIPHKNIMPICGKPLIEYTIDAAEKSNLDCCIISTDDTKMLKDVNTKNCLIQVRPEALAKDNSQMIDTLKYVVETHEAIYDLNVDVIVLLQPTCPLRDAYDIRQALIQFFDSGNNSLVSVQETCNLKKFYNSGKHSMIPGYYDRHNDKNMYVRNSAIFITSRDLINREFIFSRDPELYIMPKLRSVDIDTLEDAIIAEALLKAGGC